jgi:hypothetical protein
VLAVGLGRRLDHILRILNSPALTLAFLAISLFLFLVCHYLLNRPHAIRPFLLNRLRHSSSVYGVSGSFQGFRLWFALPSGCFGLVPSSLVICAWAWERWNLFRALIHSALSDPGVPYFPARSGKKSP